MTKEFSRTPTVETLAEEALALGEGMERPLRYVQINSFYNGSTGTIMRNLHKDLAAKGVDSYIFWGRRHQTVSDHEQCCASKAGVYLHGALSRFTDRAGFYSKLDTVKLLRRLDEIDPDVVHLHNIHGYYVNVKMLFGWLAARRCQVRWTLHDCWAFTGHCPHFQYVGCERWTAGCHNCPQKKGYPTSYFADSSKQNWKDKKSAFTSVPHHRMTLISPSFWLAELIGHSFMGDYSIEVRHNTVNRSVFSNVSSDFRQRFSVGDRFMVLSVASPWTERKDLADVVKLAEMLDSSDYVVVVVGLDRRQAKAMPDQLIALTKTESSRELAEISSSADVFFNPTMEDNFPTVNLEAQSCGTPVITYRTGGSPETLFLSESVATESFLDSVMMIKEMRWRKQNQKSKG